MIMVLSHHQGLVYCHGYRGFMKHMQGSSNGFSDFGQAFSLGSSHQHPEVNIYSHNNHSGIDSMADQEDQSRTNSPREAGSSSNKNKVNNSTNTNAVTTTTTSIQDSDQGWLRLGIGGHTEGKREHDHRDQDRVGWTARREERLVELNLFSGRGNGVSHQEERPVLTTAAPSFQQSMSFGASLFYFHQPQQQQHQGASSSRVFPHQESISNWALMRPHILPHPSIASSSSSSPSSSLMMPLVGPNFNFAPRPPFQPRFYGSLDIGGAGTSSDFRVIDPPRRPQPGIWFVLQASQNQPKEPFLPQIPKSYLRIRDGKMTVRLLMKYLVNKLRLDSESEVEIRCRGQVLEPFLTLQHVRDAIWSPTDYSFTLLPDSSTSNHIMVLHYGRSTA